MAYALKPVIDTWLKLSTAQGGSLPDTQRQLVNAGTVLPVSSFELVDNDHIRFALGRDAQGNQLQFKGRNTWFVYRPAVQLLRNGQVIALPAPDPTPSPTPSPTPNPIPETAQWLKPLTDTWLKTSTRQGALLPDAQKQFITGGTLLPLASFSPAENSHLKITLGRDAQGNQIQFKGRNTWFVYQPVVQIISGSPAPVPAPVPTPAPAPSPIPAPPRPAISLKTLIDTWLKATTAQGSSLPDDQRQFVSGGTLLPLDSFAPAANDHLKITLGRDAQGNQVQFKGRNTWFIYGPAVQLLENGQPQEPPQSPPQEPPNLPTDPDRINTRGIRLLKAFEGLRLRAYQDAVGVWTIGYGTTSGVRPGMVITEAQAEDLLKRDLRRFERAVLDLVTVPLNSDQFSALVSFAYNVGEGALASSTLLRLLNQKDYRDAADQLLRWDKAGGRTLAGLTRRRRAERALFLGQDYSQFL